MARKTVLGGSAISDLKEEVLSVDYDYVALLYRWFIPDPRNLASQIVNPCVEVTLPGKTMLICRLVVLYVDPQNIGGSNLLSVPSIQFGEDLASASSSLAPIELASGVKVDKTAYDVGPMVGAFIRKEAGSTSLAFPCIRATGEANGADDATFSQNLCLIPYNNELLLYSWKSGYSIGEKFRATFDVTLYKDN